MDSQNPLKHRLSKLLSFVSCKSCHVSDTVELPVSTRQSYELFSPRPSCPVFSLCELKGSESEEMCMRLGGTKQFLLICPPVSPAVDLHARDREVCEKKNKGREGDKKAKKGENKKEKITMGPTNNFYDWSTTDDDVDTDDDKTTLFSSDSSDSFHPPGFYHNRPIITDADDWTAVGEGFVVVKRSNDPYSDFRSSMVEMIVEKQIFGAKELEELLQTFLSLNTCHHHKVIVEVFTDIWEALFSDGYAI